MQYKWGTNRKKRVVGLSRCFASMTGGGGAMELRWGHGLGLLSDGDIVVRNLVGWEGEVVVAWLVYVGGW